MSATCPACGVAVVPGYARCPKCHASLPQRAQTSVEGGTALEPPRRFPLPAVIGAGVVGLALIIWLGVRGGHDTKATTAAPVAAPTHANANPGVTLEPAAPPPTTTRPAAPDPDDVASDLERTLQRQQLWSKVSVIGSRVDVRSNSCSDQAIQGPIAAASTRFKAAGLTSLRCVEESGSVVFTREL